MMPFTVRASIHSDLSRRSTIMCSCQSGLGNFTAARRCQVAPLSVETNTFAPRNGSSSGKSPWNGPKSGSPSPVRWSSERGSIHSPFESTVGLLSITPCQIRRGADHTGVSASGSSHTLAQTPPRPSNISMLWSKNSQSRPSGSVQRLPTRMLRPRGRLGDCESTTSRGFDQVSPSSSLVAKTKNASGLSPPATQQAQSLPLGVRSMPIVMP